MALKNLEDVVDSDIKNPLVDNDIKNIIIKGKSKERLGYEEIRSD